jgi:LacI family transcriptional regulator
MVRIQDIAQTCGLSNATVSKALNGSHEIPAETVQTVKETARRLGYIPNANARSLKMKRSFTIGVLFVDKTACGLTHEYFSAILNAAKVEAEKEGYDISFISSNNFSSRRVTYLEHARSRNIDGVLIASVDFLDPEVIELAQSGLPVVTIDYVYNGCTAIMSDNEVGVAQEVEYAYKQGHRKIAFIHGELTDVTKKRLAGFQRECVKLGLQIPSEYLKSALYHDPETVGKALDELRALPNKPTCVIFPDDVSAVATVVSSSSRRQDRIEGLSIAGYDGIALSRLLDPNLTTYCQDTETIGSLATKKLIERIEHPETFVSEQLTVSGHLQEGGTLLKI